MLKIERHNLIDQEIRKAGFVLVPDMSEKLQCSEETVRRDLKEMEKAGKLVRTHGGAYLVEKYDKGYPIELRKSYLQHTKEKLAEAAVKEIRENDVVMLDSSTTCLAIAEAILARELNITLVTNSLAICSLFSGANSGVNLICVGGTFRRRLVLCRPQHRRGPAPLLCRLRLRELSEGERGVRTFRQPHQRGECAPPDAVQRAAKGACGRPHQV